MTVSPSQDTSVHQTSIALAPILRNLMKERRISPRLLAIKAELGQDAVRNVLRGRSRSPRGETLAAMAKALDVPVSVLFGLNSDLGKDAVGQPPVPLAKPVPPLANDPGKEELQQGTIVLRVANLREPTPNLMDTALHTRSGSLAFPLTVVASLTVDITSLVCVRVSVEDALPELPAGSWLFLDTGDRTPGRGLLTIFNGQEHLIARATRENNGPLEAIAASGRIREVDICSVSGRVVGCISAPFWLTAAKPVCG